MKSKPKYVMLANTLREDIIVWQGGRKIGRVYLTDWPGEGSAMEKSYINFQYADRPFVLDGFTGRNSSHRFDDCSFERGWNACAKVNVSTRSIEVTTEIPESAEWAWRFEQWP